MVFAVFCARKINIQRRKGRYFFQSLTLARRKRALCGVAARLFCHENRIFS